MKQTELLQRIKKMRFTEIYDKWSVGRLTQEEAAEILNVSDRTFRRYIRRYEEEGLDGLIDKRIEQVSHRKAPVDEVMKVRERYSHHFFGWNVKHFYSWYQREGGVRCYTWVKTQLQEGQLVKKGKSKGVHRKHRERAPMEGMMIHQDGSTHEWVPQVQWDLIATMDDATSEHYSLFFVEEEGTQSSFRGVHETIEKKGLFCSAYTDRGSHYWHTPEAGEKVDKNNLTQFGRAMKQLGIEMIAAYSPEARGRSERAFRTHQERLPKELAKAGITSMEEANRYIQEVYLPAYNKEFSSPAMAEGSAFVPRLGQDLNDILCEQYERTVGKDNCVQFETLKLQIPAQSHRMNYVKVKVKVHRYMDGDLSIFHGPRCLAKYTSHGNLIMEVIKNIKQKEIAA